jgi:hypothetical protein
LWDPRLNFLSEASFYRSFQFTQIVFPIDCEMNNHRRCEYCSDEGDFPVIRPTVVCYINGFNGMANELHFGSGVSCIAIAVNVWLAMSGVPACH